MLSEEGIDKDTATAGLDSLGKGRLRVSIYEMFILTAGIAVIVATAPVVSYVIPPIWSYAWMVACSTVFVVTTVVVNYQSQARKSVLQGAGRKLADGYKREMWWVRRKKSINLIAFLVGLVLVFVVAHALSLIFRTPTGNVRRSNALDWVIAIQQFFLASLALSNTVFNLIWKLGTGQVEFYERGFCMSGTRFYAWDQIDQVSRSAIYKSSVTVTLRPYGLFTRRRYPKEVTLVIRVSDDKVEQVIERFVTSRDLAVTSHK